MTIPNNPPDLATDADSANVPTTPSNGPRKGIPITDSKRKKKGPTGVKMNLAFALQKYRKKLIGFKNDDVDEAACDVLMDKEDVGVPPTDWLLEGLTEIEKASEKIYELVDLLIDSNNTLKEAQPKSGTNDVNQEKSSDDTARQPEANEPEEIKTSPHCGPELGFNELVKSLDELKTTIENKFEQMDELKTTIENKFEQMDELKTTIENKSESISKNVPLEAEGENENPPEPEVHPSDVAPKSNFVMSLIAYFSPLVQMGLTVLVGVVLVVAIFLMRTPADTLSNSANGIDDIKRAAAEQTAKLDRIEGALKNPPPPAAVALPKDLLAHLDKSLNAATSVDTAAKQMDEKLTKLKDELKELQDVVAQVKAIRDSGVPGIKQEHLAILQKLPEAATAITRASDKFKELDNLKGTLSDIKKETEAAAAFIKPFKMGLPKEITDQMEKIKASSTAAETKVIALEATINELKGKVPEFTKQLQALTETVTKVKAAQGHDPQDVLIVALNSPNLPVKTHLRAYQELFRDLPRDKDGPLPLRVGLVLYKTEQATQKIKLDDSTFNLDSVADAGTAASERPAKFGVDLKGMFDPRRPRQRVVLVASAECDPLNRKTPGWSDIPQVDVILIQCNKNDIGIEKLARWHEFCRDRRGFVSIISFDGIERQTDQLRDVLQQLSQPRK